MRTRTSLLPALAAIVIIVASGYVHGVWSFRWSAAREVHEAAEKLARVPMQIGDWSGTDTPLDDRQIRIARIDASVSRRYVNTKTGQVVSILLVCGRPGPISVHTPDVCYAGAGFEVMGDRAKVSVDYGVPKPAEFWEIRVDKTAAGQNDSLAIDFGWSSGGAWTAPAVDARLRFAGYPVLYKMYVIRDRPRPEISRGSDPGVDFLKAMLPQLQQILDGSTV